MHRFVLGSSYVVIALLALPARGSAMCQQGGVASASFIGAHDLRAIDRATRRLPHVTTEKIAINVGGIVPPDVPTQDLPSAVVKVLPQYAGYRALTIGRQLVIVDKTSRAIAYAMPLHGSIPTNCP